MYSAPEPTITVPEYVARLRLMRRIVNKWAVSKNGKRRSILQKFMASHSVLATLSEFLTRLSTVGKPASFTVLGLVRTRCWTESQQ